MLVEFPACRKWKSASCASTKRVAAVCGQRRRIVAKATTGYRKRVAPTRRFGRLPHQCAHWFAMTIPPSEIKDFAHLPLHKGGSGAVDNCQLCIMHYALCILCRGFPANRNLKQSQQFVTEPPKGCPVVSSQVRNALPAGASRHCQLKKGRDKFALESILFTVAGSAGASHACRRGCCGEGTAGGGTEKTAMNGQCTIVVSLRDGF